MVCVLVQGDTNAGVVRDAVFGRLEELDYDA